MSFLTLQAVRKRYGQVAALDGIHLSVPLGSRTAVVGPSGSGKTTLLRIIAGYEVPDEGRVELDGQVLAEGASGVPAFRRGIGVVSQDGALFPHLSIAENIGFGLPRNQAGRDSQIAALVEMVGLDASMLPRRPDQISGGQQQRVALARALARKPRLILLDEPFSALDAGLRVSTRRAVADLLERSGVTTILVTHDQEEALSFADQVAVMREGRLAQVGSPRELYLRPLDAMIAAFLGDVILLPADVADGFAACAVGRISVDQDRRGPAQIMLRPEQISLDRKPPKPGDLRGRVTDIDFAGTFCTISVDLLAGESQDATGFLRLRRSLVEPLDRGDIVRIKIAGPAHLLDVDTRSDARDTRPE
jgi:iron(III) transport system ATP-binding protein